MSYEVKDYVTLNLDPWFKEVGEDKVNQLLLQKYFEFIIQSVDRYDPNRYSEWHHVMPKCLDKSRKYRDEVVKINGRDHFTAHLILVDCLYGAPKSMMTYSLMRMKGNLVKGGEQVSPEDWERARYEYSKVLSERGRKMVGPLNPMYGKTHKVSDKQRYLSSIRMKGNQLSKTKKSQEHYESLKKRYKGEGNPFYGKCHTEDTKRRISDGRLGTKNPCYHKLWITNGVVNKRVSIEDLDDYLQQGFVKGRVVSDKTRESMSKSQSKRLRDSKGRWI